ncbi:hypothetical protein OG203_25555 [Nocardia sp. NBC_01499]|uniref:hypothetical protein n=1 Tax=Nocardia sp. NBC_01499 TaxID=2903597 RepID=UPI003865B895
MTGIQQSATDNESARWFVRETTGAVHLLSIKRDGAVTTLPHQPTLEEYPDLSAPLRDQIVRRVHDAAQVRGASRTS